MTLQSAESFTISIGDGNAPENFNLLAPIQSLQMEVENSLIDTQNLQTTGWRAQLDQAGRQRITLQLEGLFSDSTAEETLRLQAFHNHTTNFRLDFGNGDSLNGPFQVARYERRGIRSEGAEGFRLRLVNNGAVTFAAA